MWQLTSEKFWIKSNKNKEERKLNGKQGIMHEMIEGLYEG